MGKKFRFFYRLTVALIKKERQKIFAIFVLISLAVIFIAFLGQPFLNFVSTTIGKIKPIYIEAVVGKPETFNPLFSKTELEKEINGLVFRSLIKIDRTGKPVGDLVDNIEVKNDTQYILTLKNNIYWQDGVKFTADDVVYTIQTGQNSLYHSEIEETFRDVEVKKISDYIVLFQLKEPFSPFLTALTIGILPKHIPLNNYRPIGTGDFRFVDIKPDYSILEGSKVRIKFQYYPSESVAEAAIELGLVHGLPYFNPQGNNLRNWNNFEVKNSTMVYQEVIAFFNLKDEIFKEKPVRQAFAYATPKVDIATDSYGKKGTLAFNSLPFLPAFQTNMAEKYEFNLNKASQLLTSAGWILKGNYRFKDNKKLSFKITTIDDPKFLDSAVKMRDSFKKIGAEVEVVVVSGVELKNQTVPNRDFQVLLTSQLLGFDPDQYVLWHTTQIKQSNISGITSPKIDKLLEDGRKASDPKIRAEKYQEFTRILLDEEPAIFLYYPNFSWLLSKRISGVNLANFKTPVDRFTSIDQWKIKTPFF